MNLLLLQVYVTASSSEIGKVAADAWAALQSDLSKKSGLAPKSSLYQASCWPFPPNLRAVGSDTIMASIVRDFSLLEGYVYDLSASAGEVLKDPRTKPKHLAAFPATILAVSWQAAQLQLTGIKADGLRER